MTNLRNAGEFEKLSNFQLMTQLRAGLLVQQNIRIADELIRRLKEAGLTIGDGSKDTDSDPLNGGLKKLGDEELRELQADASELLSSEERAHFEIKVESEWMRRRRTDFFFLRTTEIPA